MRPAGLNFVNSQPQRGKKKKKKCFGNHLSKQLSVWVNINTSIWPYHIRWRHRNPFQCAYRSLIWKIKKHSNMCAMCKTVKLQAARLTSELHQIRLVTATVTSSWHVEVRGCGCELPPCYAFTVRGNLASAQGREANIRRAHMTKL